MKNSWLTPSPLKSRMLHGFSGLPASRRSRYLAYILFGIFLMIVWSYTRPNPQHKATKNGRLVCSRYANVELPKCHDAKITRWSGVEFSPPKNYTLQPACQKYTAADLVMVVMSNTQEFGLRMAIRETISLPKHWNEMKVLPVFVVGLSADRDPHSIHEYVVKESIKSGDVLQLPVREGLYSDSRLMIGTLYWLRSCACKTKFILKLGRNVLPNIFLIQETLKNNKEKLYCLPSNRVVERDNRKLQYVRLDEYPQDTYPTYCKAETYIIKIDAAMILLRTAEEHDIFKLEGPYITGLLRQSSCIPFNTPETDIQSQKIHNKRMPLSINWSKTFLLQLNEKSVGNFLTYWEDMLRRTTGQREKVVYVNAGGG